jgi:hypothetical protein
MKRFGSDDIKYTTLMTKISLSNRGKKYFLNRMLRIEEIAYPDQIFSTLQIRKVSFPAGRKD